MTAKRAFPVTLMGPSVSGVAAAVGLWGATVMMAIVFVLGVLLAS